MSDAENGDQRPLVTVKPLRGPRPNAEMSSIGWAILLGLLIVLLPLLPFLLIAYVFSRLFGRADPRTDAE